MATSIRFDESLQSFMLAVQDMEGSRCNDETFIYQTTGSTYARVGFKDSAGNELGTYCFVVARDTENLKEGDILRKASENAPASGVRGNIFDNIDDVMKNMLPDGPAKLPVGRRKVTASDTVVAVPSENEPAPTV